MKHFSRLLLFLLLSGCTGMPEKVKPVDQFELGRYLGKWYEIARLDHSFERGLDQVTAEYSLKSDGSVRVINKGYSSLKQAWSQAEGKAHFVDLASVGHLKVSFFGPFYGSYVIFDLDKTNYEYAVISGPTTSYLWLLSRTPTVSPVVMERFLSIAKESGFDTSKIIFVKQE